MCRYALENITLEEYRYLDIQQVRHVCVGGTGEHHRGGAQISRQTAGDTSICWDAPDIEFVRAAGYPPSQKYRISSVAGYRIIGLPI